jgi:rod shape-determining protein MreB
LAGGGAMLHGLDKRIEKKTQLKVHVADDPLKAVVRGTGEILKNLEKYKPVLIT